MTLTRASGTRWPRVRSFRLLKLKISVVRWRTKKQPAAQQIAHGPGLAVVEMAGGQEVQAQELGEKVGVGDIVGVLLAVVGLHAGGIGEHDVIAVILKTVHQPIPVVGGLDGDGGDALLVRLEQLQDGSQVAGELLVNQTTTAFVHEAAEGVVAVQVNFDHNLHSGSPVGCRFGFEFAITPQTTHPPAG